MTSEAVDESLEYFEHHLSKSLMIVQEYNASLLQKTISSWLKKLYTNIFPEQKKIAKEKIERLLNKAGASAVL